MKERVLAGDTIKELSRRIEFCENEKNKLINQVRDLKNKLLDGEISQRDYLESVNKKRNRRTIQEWFDYYDYHIIDCKSKRASQKKRLRISSIKKVFFFSLVFFGLLIILSGIFYFRGEISPIFFAPPTSTFTDNLNIVTSENFNYNWNVENPGELQSAKVSGSIEGDGRVLIYLQDKLILDSSNLPQIQLSPNGTLGNETLPPQENATVPNVTEGNAPSPEGNTTNVTVPKTTSTIINFVEHCEETCDLAGFNLNESSHNLRIEITGNTTLQLDSITYEIPAEGIIIPQEITKTEEDHEEGKRVFASIPQGLENKPIISKIPNSWKIKNKNSLKIHWDEGNSDIDFTVKDLDSDGNIDEIEWLAPASGEQTFSIIVVTEAEHLDSNRIFISNIFEEVREQDGLWSETIFDGDYVRVTFARNLNSSNDITLYPRIISGNPIIEVYEFNSTRKIAKFLALNDSEYNRVLLTNLLGNQKVFDLRVIGGSAEFDHIIDPSSGGIFPQPLGQMTQSPNFASTMPGAFSKWIQPQNAFVSDNVYASGVIAQNPVQDFSNFSFSFPPSIIVSGISVSVEATTNLAGTSANLQVQLMKANAPVGNVLMTPVWTSGTEVIYTVGGPMEMWGTTWSKSDIENLGFGVFFPDIGGGPIIGINGTAAQGDKWKKLNAENSASKMVFSLIDMGPANTPQLKIDHVYITVYYASLQNSPPSIVSVTDSPDPVVEGSPITFSVSWLDFLMGGETELGKIHICKTNSIDSSTQTCLGGSWCDSATFTSNSPETCQYATTPADAGTSPNDYYAFVCDDQNACSDSVSGTFDVLPQNSPPSIVSVNQIGPVIPQGGTTTDVTVIFTAEDLDGPDDLNGTSANASFSKIGETTRNSIPHSCTAGAPSGNQINYTCVVAMWYYDGEGTWNITVSIEDNQTATASNSSTNFTYALLKEVNLTPTTLSFGTIPPGTVDTLASSAITIENWGNYDIPSNGIGITGKNLTGDDSITILSSGQFSANNNLACNSGLLLDDGIQKPVPNIVIPRGSGSTDDLFFCLELMPNLPAQDYSATGPNSWDISVLLTLFILGSTKRRKEKKSLKNDKLVRALNLMTNELRKRYSSEKSEAIKLIIKELSEKYHISKKELIRELELRDKKEIPMAIFTKELGGLEALCKYLKENLGMSYHEIAKLLQRDDRTIWTAYNKAKEKKKESIELDGTEENVSIEIFKDRKMTILESIIRHLRERGAKYSEIGLVLQRDQRNIQTIYLRAIKK